MTERIYAVVHRTKKLAYVGRTSRRFEERWKEHLADAANPLYSKKLAEYLRYEGDEFEFLECEESETASEHEWEQRFQADGYELLNVGGTNRGAPKQRRSEREGWEERPVYVPTSRTGVGLMKLTQSEWEEYKALPTEEERWEWISERRPKRQA